MNFVPEVLAQFLIDFIPFSFPRLPQRVNFRVGHNSILSKGAIRHCSQRALCVLMTSNVSITKLAKIDHVGLSVVLAVYLLVFTPDGFVITVGTFHI